MSNWIFLRGLMRERRHWGSFPDAFRQAMPDARIVMLDLPGNGERHADSSPVRVAEMLRACRADLHARGLHGPYRLFALSLGAMLATAWCTAYPDEISAAVQVNTSMRPHGRFYQRLRWQNYGAFAALAVAGNVLRQESTILRLTSNRHGGDAGLLADWIGYQRQHPVRRANALRQLLAAARFHAPAGAPAVPLLLLASRGDRLVDCSCSVRLAQAWHAELRLHPDAGHDLPLDDPDWVARTVQSWLGRQG
jgi:pimeloyl-ACP methyl ester carboxylesterase